MHSQALPVLPTNVDKVKDPLSRFFEREAALAGNLLAVIRRDLATLIKVCAGQVKQTNAIRGLLSDLTKATVPAAWLRYQARSLPVGSWLVDFSKRLEQLTRIVDGGDLSKCSTSLGLLFHPHAFVTASRQAAAHATGSSLEQLHLQVDLETPGGDGTFAIEGASRPALAAQ